MEIAAVQSAENMHSGLGNGSSGSAPPPPSMSPLALNGKIEFQPARKPFNGFINSGSGDLWTQTVNLDSGRKRPPGDLDPRDHPRRKVDGSDFLENGLDPDLCFEITSRRIGAGLENLGNTCFLNSVLQCLTYTEPLAAYLQSGKHQNSCHVAGFCALCAIQKHVSNALQSTGRSLIPKDLVSNLRCISRNFRNARQEDAHEYMVNLLESMHKCCLPSGVPSESPVAYEKSLVHKIFGGRLRSQVECQQCFYCSNKFDHFLDLSLEIVKADSLLVALRNFTAAEMLDGGEKHYQCQQCKEKVRANKRLTIHNAPYVLTIHLKRFHAHDPGWKIDKKVLFEHSLDLKPFFSGSYDGDLKYSLYGVLVHYGHNTHSGHYVCFVCTSSGMWYLLNDNEVRQVTEKHVLEQKAYMLFYVRDRKNVSVRKPVDVIPKEHTKAAFHNNANLVYRSFLRESSHSSVNGSHTAGCSAGDKTNILNIGPVKEIFAKEALSQRNNEAMNPECTVLKQDPVLGPSSSASLLKDMSKCDYSGSPGLLESLSLSGPSVNSNSDTSKLEHVSTINGAKFTDSDEVTFCSTGSQNSSNVTLVMNVALQQINHGLDAADSTDVLPGGPCDGTAAKFQCSASSLDSDDKPLDNMEPVRALYKASCGSSRVDSISSGQPAGNILNDHAGDASKEVAHQLVNSSIPLVVPNECLLREVSECRHHKKLEKKLMKYQTLRMRVGSNFFRASLGLQKKKKDKKNKKHILGPQNPIKEQLLDRLSPSESGPSTSAYSVAISVGSVNSQRKSAKFGLEKGSSLTKFSNVPVEDVITGELSQRNNQKGAAFAMDGQQKGFNTIHEANQHSARDIYSAENSGRDASQKGMMSIPSQGLEDTGVAHWDEMVLPPSETAEASAAQNFSVGYVPHEWDKEYDRGKRKKPRHSKHKFGGLNPFQEIATKKTQFKKAKINRFSRGNQPFQK